MTRILFPLNALSSSKRIGTTLAITLGLATSSMAVPITLFNTGVDAGGTVVPHNTIGDAHYTLTSVPAGSTTTTRAITSAGGFPIGPWLGDNTDSRWIGPDNDRTDSQYADDDLTGPVGLYEYQTTFDLTGLVPLTALISGRWSADDSGTDILLNGVSTGQTASNYFSWTDFSLSDGFLPGINTITIIVNNSGGGPTGLRVEMSGTASASVPESGATVALFGLALVGLFGARRMMQKKAAA